NVHEYLDLGEFLAKQRRRSRVRQGRGKFVEAELKFVRQFHIVCLRSVERRQDGLTQARLELVRRQRRDGHRLGFERLFKIIEGRAVMFEVIAQLLIVPFAGERIEALKPALFCRLLFKRLHGAAPRAPSPVEKRADQQRANCQTGNQRSQRSVLLKPLHGSFSGLRSRSRNSYGTAHSVSLGTELDLMTRSGILGSITNSGDWAR